MSSPVAATPRFVAPHFIEVEGSADMPGAVRRACAFTTTVPGWAKDHSGATHRHECELRSSSGGWHDGGAVHWRTRTENLLGGAAVVTEGCAPELTQAIAAALAAAHAAPPTPGGDRAVDRVLCMAPGFVEMAREPGLPRIWACSYLSAEGEAPPERPWTHLRTAFIRAWPGRSDMAYQGEMESLPFSALGSQEAGSQATRQVTHWHAATFGAAVAAFHSHGAGAALRG